MAFVGWCEDATQLPRAILSPSVSLPLRFFRDKPQPRHTHFEAHPMCRPALSGPVLSSPGLRLRSRKPTRKNLHREGGGGRRKDGKGGCAETTNEWHLPCCMSLSIGSRGMQEYQHARIAHMQKRETSTRTDLLLRFKKVPAEARSNSCVVVSAQLPLQPAPPPSMRESFLAHTPPLLRCVIVPALVPTCKSIP